MNNNPQDTREKTKEHKWLVTCLSLQGHQFQPVRSCLRRWSLTEPVCCLDLPNAVKTLSQALYICPPDRTPLSATTSTHKFQYSSDIDVLFNILQKKKHENKLFVSQIVLPFEHLRFGSQMLQKRQAKKKTIDPLIPLARAYPQAVYTRKQCVPLQ